MLHCESYNIKDRELTGWWQHGGNCIIGNSVELSQRVNSVRQLQLVDRPTISLFIWHQSTLYHAAHMRWAQRHAACIGELAQPPLGGRALPVGQWISSDNSRGFVQCFVCFGALIEPWLYQHKRRLVRNIIGPPAKLLPEV